MFWVIKQGTYFIDGKRYWNGTQLGKVEHGFKYTSNVMQFKV